MKITSYYPTLVTRYADDVIRFMKEMNYEVVRTKRSFFNNSIEYVLQSPDGSKMEVIYKDIPEDYHAMKVNVDNFEEALNYYKNEGLKTTEGPLKNNKRAAFLTTPANLQVLLMQNI